MAKKIRPETDRHTTPITRKMKLKAVRSQSIPCLCDIIFLTSIASYYAIIHASNGPVSKSSYAALSHTTLLFLVFSFQFCLRFKSKVSTKKSINLVMACLMCLGTLRFFISIIGFLLIFYTMTGLQINQTSAVFVAGGVLGIIYIVYVIVSIFFVMKTLDILRDNLGALKGEKYAVSTIQPASTLGRVDG
ncbi:hypothetical protein CAEBREN_01746 [Caenorhabditis brenneri]|uniref:Uncharacterized protein n=1 Tax=Caenorhabditis brenneri TaxID=135651 RepID=G0NM18_CAEBE|nr:hypothetical protein CAEBREN_01746 [Caenorhabditis brenneri]